MKSKIGVYYNLGLRTIWLIAFAIIFLNNKIELHSTFNKFHTTVLDNLAPILTQVGDGFFLILIAVVFLFIELRISILFFISFLITSGLVQFLKHFVFDGMMRPMYFFRNDSSFNTIEGFSYHFYNSFPSGHATSCFVLFTILAYYFTSKISLQILFLVCAIIIALTRVYLSQHFLNDVLAGSIIGTLSAHYLWIFLYPRLERFNMSILKSKKN